jgi:hypothetical protein
MNLLWSAMVAFVYGRKLTKDRCLHCQRLAPSTSRVPGLADSDSHLFFNIINDAAALPARKRGGLSSAFDKPQRDAFLLVVLRMQGQGNGIWDLWHFPLACLSTDFSSALWASG